MGLFFFNLLLAIAWAGFTGAMSPLNLAFGFLLGYLALLWLAPFFQLDRRYTLAVWRWGRLIVMFHVELFISSFQVIWDVITPGQSAEPALVEMPLDVKSDIGITLVANLISLTPGTLSIDVSEDRKTLTVHAMFATDKDELIKSMKDGMERWVKEAVEP